MSLSDTQIDRYARQIIIPGIGATGQEKLIGSTVAVYGHADGVAQTNRYLTSAGVRTVATDTDPAVDWMVLAGIDEGVVPPLQESWLLDRPTVWYRIVGTTIVSGVSGCLASAFTDARIDPHKTREPRNSLCEPLLHAVAACDAANTTIALILGWSRVATEVRCEMRLA